jgi:hypothetical protein
VAIDTYSFSEFEVAWHNAIRPVWHLPFANHIVLILDVGHTSFKSIKQQHFTALTNSYLTQIII